ncbi:MAG: type II secretion system secretin GspD [Thiohalocapsa sp.]
MTSVYRILTRRGGSAIRLAVFAMVAWLGGCAPAAVDLIPDAVSAVLAPAPEPATAAAAPNGPISLTPRRAANRAISRPEIVEGTGEFVKPAVAAAARAPVVSGSDVTLDFAAVDVRDVLKTVLGDLLHLPYAVDPAVQGTVTLQTGRPVPRTAVLNVLTSALQLSGVALIDRDGLYLAVPVANANKQAPIGGTTGFVTRVVTPRYVAASDLERVLEPLLPPGTTAKADPSRNVLVVSGAAPDVAAVMGNVAVFDVDALRGMSFALLPLQHGRAREVAAEVNNLLNSAGKPVADTVKVVPIDRMNGVLVTAMQPAYLQRVRGWVERLDRGDVRADQQLFVYRVQNGRAADLARVLRRALGLEAETGAGGAPPERPATAATAAPVSGAATPTQIDALLSKSANTPPSGETARPAERAADRNEPLAGVPAAASLAGGGRVPPVTEVRVTPDEVNNALVITGSALDYAPIEAALQQLDITPLQVMIEATVAEVTLTDDLNYGLQYFFNSGKFTGIFGPNVKPSGGTALPAPFGTTFPGFGFLQGANLAFTSGGNNFVLQALSKITNVRVLSSPNLLVRNNGAARLQVGDQVPIATQSATSTLTNTAQTVNSIDYRDTGIILNVTPRVNAGGLVLLDISEEVSNAAKTDSSALDSPTIAQRRVKSSVAVNDGQTIALAGLIRDTRNNAKNGLPWLEDLPGVGLFFGARSQSLNRTELLVLITPRVIRNRHEGDALTAELRSKLRATIPVARRQ